MVGDNKEEFGPKIRCDSQEKAREIVSRTWIRATIEKSTDEKIHFLKDGRIVGLYSPSKRNNSSGWVSVKRNIGSMTAISEAIKNFKRI